MTEMRAALAAVMMLTACHDATRATLPGTVRGAWSGTWNYVQPDANDGTNVAHLGCPDGFSLAIPQIGWIVFTQTDTRLSATTDQGCTWTFAEHGGIARLSPASQTCFNNVIGSSYTLTRWDISMHGAGETEVIFGKSHQPGGECDFTLANGRRTQVSEDGADPTAAFVGDWSYDATDTNGGNIEQLTCSGDVPGMFRPAVARGSIIVTKTADHQIQASTDDGCKWSLAVSGNTAELMPVPQTCGNGSATTFWSMTSDARRAATFMSGARPLAGVSCRFLLATGKLTKR